MEITYRSTTSSGRMYTSVRFFTRNVLTSRDVHPQVELDENEDVATTLPCGINFKFSGDANSHGWILTPNFTYPQFHSGISSMLPFDETSVFLNLHDLSNSDQARLTLLEMIEDWPVREETRQMFVGFALDRARRAVRSMPDSHNVVDIHVHMLVLHKHISDQRRRASSSGVPPPPEDPQHPPTWDDLIQRSNYAQEVRMVQAEDSSIESLERRKILVMDSTETCPICLENFCLDTEAVCTACSHLFHENCIKKWLRIRNNCPLCRFKLPAASC